MGVPHAVKRPPFLVLFLVPMTFACEGSDEKPEGAPHDGNDVVSHFQAGPRCTEYRGSGVAPGAKAGPCPEALDQGELCWVCRDGESQLSAMLGTTTISHYQYSYEPITDRLIGCESSDSDGDSCVVIFGGTFEPVADGVPGPTGTMRAEITPGTAQSTLGPLRASIPFFWQDGRVSNCSNLYGDVPAEAAALYPPLPCPDENRCPTACAISTNAVHGTYTNEFIYYDVSAASCTSKGSDEACVAGGGTVLTY
jgi:hypothetical protein